MTWFGITCRDESAAAGGGVAREGLVRPLRRAGRAWQQPPCLAEGSEGRPACRRMAIIFEETHE